MVKVMLDTNVLLDYYLGREPGCTHATRLLTHLFERGALPYVSSLSLKDLFFLICAQLKRSARAQGGEGAVDVSAAAIREVAWACTQQAAKRCIVVPVGAAECLQACSYRALHGDFEDDLQIAAAQEAKAEYLVTNDVELARHAPVACLTPKDVLAALGA